MIGRNRAIIPMKSKILIKTLILFWYQVVRNSNIYSHLIILHKRRSKITIKKLKTIKSN